MFRNHPLRGRAAAAFLAAASLVLGSSSVRAADIAYPTKPIKIIVGFAPGGGSDFIARLLGQKLTEKFKQAVIVDNRPGAGGNLAADAAVKSPPDGYTLFLTAASYTVNPSLYKLSFDSVNDVTPIAQLARGPFIIAVNPKVPVNTLQELVALAKKEPRKLAYASSGNGSIVNMVTEYFLDTAKIDILHVPYKGTSPALTDTIAGQTQLVFGTVASTLPFVKSGQLKALAVTTPQRLPALPNVPTVSEAGFPSYQVTNWHGLIGPKGMDPAIVEKLNKAANEALKAPGMDAQLSGDGLVAAGGSPADFKALLESEIPRWSKVAKARGVKAE